VSMNNAPIERIFVARILFDPLRRSACCEREKEKCGANLHFSLRQRKMHPKGSDLSK